MFYVRKRIEIAGSHHLCLDYESKCGNVHGHNWIVTVYCRAEELNSNGMVVDFTTIKSIVNQFDHADLNTLLPFSEGVNPTAENIAKFIRMQIPNCYRVDVQESEGNVASYEVE